MTEYSLHVELKEWYSVQGDEVEVEVDDYVIDVVKDGVLIEVQTRNLSTIKKKLAKLISTNQVRLVYPMYSLRPLPYWPSGTRSLVGGAVCRCAVRCFLSFLQPLP